MASSRWWQIIKQELRSAALPFSQPNTSTHIYTSGFIVLFYVHTYCAEAAHIKSFSAYLKSVWCIFLCNIYIMLSERMDCFIGGIWTQIIHHSLHFIIAFVFLFASVDFSYNRVEGYLRLHISFTRIQQ